MTFALLNCIQSAKAHKQRDMNKTCLTNNYPNNYLRNVRLKIETGHSSPIHQITLTPRPIRQVATNLYYYSPQRPEI